MGVDEVVAFIHNVSYDRLGADVIHSARRSLLDTIAVAAAGRKTPCADIICEFASEFHGGAEDNTAKIMFDHRRASIPGAAMAAAMFTDSVDAHDTDCAGKGHIGIMIIPSLIAIAERYPMSGKEFIAAMVMGYEISNRATMALHATVTDYHTTGASAALGCTAIVARALKLDPQQTKHALGIAEYYGPRSQMMRCVMHPTMVKGGHGWGALTGVSAGFLASKGFTGAPAITVDHQDVARIWDTLGDVWKMQEQSIKPYPVCHWSQPGLASLKGLIAKERLTNSDIASAKLFVFHDATKLQQSMPDDTDQAQFNTTFPLACQMVRGCMGVDEVLKGFHDPDILNAVNKITVIEKKEYTDSYPVIQYAHVEVTTTDGRCIEGERCEQWGKPDSSQGSVTDEQLLEKCNQYLKHQLNPDDTKALVDAVWNLEGYTNAFDAFKLAFRI